MFNHTRIDRFHFEVLNDFAFYFCIAHLWNGKNAILKWKPRSATFLNLRRKYLCCGAMDVAGLHGECGRTFTQILLHLFVTAKNCCIQTDFVTVFSLFSIFLQISPLLNKTNISITCKWLIEPFLQMTTRFCMMGTALRALKGWG